MAGEYIFDSQALILMQGIHEGCLDSVPISWGHSIHDEHKAGIECGQTYYL